MKKVTVWGTSFKKVADEAQLLAHYKLIKTICPDADVTFIARTHGKVQERFPGINIVPFAHVRQALTRLLGSDLLVISGGPFFESLEQMTKCALLIFSARLFKIPVLVYGVTVFPIKLWWARLGYRWILNGVNAIHVRDHVAARALSDIGLDPSRIHTGSDPRLILDPDAEDHIRSILAAEGILPPFIALTTRYIHPEIPGWVKRAHGFEKDAVGTSNSTMARVVNYLTRFGTVVLIPMHPDMSEDLKTAEEIRRHMQNPGMLKVLGRRYLASEVLGILQASEMLFAGRLGSALFCSMTGTPVMAVAYEDRMTEVMDDLGLGDYVFDWRSLDYEKMIFQADRLYATRTDISKLLTERADGMCRKAWQDSGIYKNFLKDI